MILPAAWLPYRALRAQRPDDTHSVPMTKTTFATLDQHRAAMNDWYIVDASEHVLGRMCVRIAEVLMGKHTPLYTPHLSVGAGVIVINAEKVITTGMKRERRVYTAWSGYVGGLRKRTLGDYLEKNPEELINNAVRRMLPKTRMGHNVLRRLKVYRGAEHEQMAQKPVALKI